MCISSLNPQLRRSKCYVSFAGIQEFSGSKQFSSSARIPFHSSKLHRCVWESPGGLCKRVKPAITSQHFRHQGSSDIRQSINFVRLSRFVCPSGKSSFKMMVSTENWWQGTDYRGKAVRAPLTGLGPKVTAWATARPSRPEIHIQRCHKSPRLSLCLLHVVTWTAILGDRNIFFRCKCQSQCLFEHVSDMVCSTFDRAILLSCNERCTSTLCSPTWTIPCQ